jgi:AcrR family transcriptional regulator
LPPETNDCATSELGRREQAKRARTQRILDAGLALLREEHGQGLTMERVATRAEVSPMTVFNLVGNRQQLWSAMADHALGSLDLRSIFDEDPHVRATKIVDAVVRKLRSDPVVYRGLLAGWSHGGRLLAHDPTEALIDCFRAAVSQGQLTPDADVRGLGEVLAAGLIGVITQWSAGVLGDRTFGRRARAVVDVVFAAGRA